MEEQCCCLGVGRCNSIDFWLDVSRWRRSYIGLVLDVGLVLAVGGTVMLRNSGVGWILESDK